MTNNRESEITTRDNFDRINSIPLSDSILKQGFVRSSSSIIETVKLATLLTIQSAHHIHDLLPLICFEMSGSDKSSTVLGQMALALFTHSSILVMSHPSTKKSVKCYYIADVIAFSEENLLRRGASTFYAFDDALLFHSSFFPSIVLTLVYNFV